MTMKTFLASVKSEGLMRGARFTVEMTPPKIFANKKLILGDMRKILLYCDATNLPGITLSTAQSRTFGEVREMPWEKMFDNINMSFYADNSMSVKMMFDSWITNVQDPIRRTFAYYDDYVTDIKITVLDTQDKARYAVTLYECYPKNVSPLSLDMASKDVLKVQVSMNYKYWKSEIIDGATTKSSDAKSIPEQYFTNFNAFQSGLNSLENINISPMSFERGSLGIGTEII